jgi:hypothetical protein
MKGVWSEGWSTERCKACLADGQEENLKYLIIEDGEGSTTVYARCLRCHGCETRASSVAAAVRRRLAQERTQTTRRVGALVAFGFLLAILAIGFAVSALAAMK